MSQRLSNERPLLRLGMLISGGGRTLMNLHRLIGEGKLPAEIAVVVASRKCKGVDLAREAGLSVKVVPYKKMADVQLYSRQISGYLDEAEVELVVLAGFLSMWHIPPQYEGRVINIHPALLPSFGGKGMYGHHVHEAVLKAGCKITGCTVHFVNNEYDTGPIILQRAVPVLESDDPDSLAARVFDQEMLALPEAITLYAAGKLRIHGRGVSVG